MKQIHWITPNGEEILEPTDTAPTLEAMQKYVEGDIEVVNCLFHGKPTQMIVNDVGMINHQALNWKATSVYHCNWIHREGKIPDSPICGKAILLEELPLD